MARNLKKALGLIQKDLEKKFSKIKFNYFVEENRAYAENNLTVNGVKGNVYVVFEVDNNENSFYFGFEGEYEKNEQTLALINKFNSENPFFKVVLAGRSGKSLYVYHSFIYRDDTILKDYASWVMVEFTDVVKYQTLQELFNMAKYR